MSDPHGALTGSLDAPVVPMPSPAEPAAAPTPLVGLAGGEAAVDERVPTLDADGLLRHRGKWVPIPDTQLPVVALLVRNLGRLVGNHEVRQAYEGAGGSGSSTSLRSLVYRLGQRVSEVDLRLHVVRSRGLVLDIA
jgi:hypothetical protein